MKEETKIVVYKDGSWIIREDGITWEYENDKDFLVTISLAQIENELSEVKNKYEMPGQREVMEKLNKLTIIT